MLRWCQQMVRSEPSEGERSRDDDLIQVLGRSHALSPVRRAKKFLFLHKDFCRFYSKKLNTVGKELCRPIRTGQGSCVSWWRRTDRLRKPAILERPQNLGKQLWIECWVVVESGPLPRVLSGNRKGHPSIPRPNQYFLCPLVPVPGRATTGIHYLD